MVADDDFNHLSIARGAKQLLDAGVPVQLGAHGQLQGLGAHWELWMLVQGGMTPLEALRGGTIDGARYLGLDKDLGSLEAGQAGGPGRARPESAREHPKQRLGPQRDAERPALRCGDDERDWQSPEYPTALPVAVGRPAREPQPPAFRLIRIGCDACHREARADILRNCDPMRSLRSVFGVLAFAAFSTALVCAQTAARRLEPRPISPTSNTTRMPSRTACA